MMGLGGNENKGHGNAGNGNIIPFPGTLLFLVANNEHPGFMQHANNNCIFNE